VLFHPEAQAEYEAALAWYQARSTRSAARFEVEVDRVLKLIAASPGSFPRYDDDHQFAILKRFPFSLVYQPQPAHVFIVAVAHSSRSAGYWRGRTGSE
jgi:plasmid stabilization system protein ParE